MIVVAKDWKDQNWVLGDVRRAPVGELYTQIDNDELPKFQRLDHKLIIGDIEPSSRNRSKESANILIYNRVPKCASTSVKRVIELMGLRLGFNATPANVYWSSTNTKEEEEKLVAKLKSIKHLQFFDKHSYFVDIMRYFPIGCKCSLSEF